MTKPAPQESAEVAGSTSTLIELALPAVIAIVLTIGWVIALDQLPDGQIKVMFDGIIQHICAFLLLWHVGIVMIRWLTVIRREAQALSAGFLPSGTGQLSLDGVILAASRAGEYEQARGPSMITRRIILAATNLTVRGDEEALGQLMHRRAETDRQRAEDGYAVPNFIFWAIPILGFIGTVVGIGVAIAGLDGADVGTASLLRDKIGGIAGALGQAFDTTQVALMFSVVALLVQTLINRMESRLHDDLEDHLIYQLESRIAKGGGDQQGMIDAVKQLQETVQNLNQTIVTDGEQRKTGQQQYLQQLSRAHDSLSETIHDLPETVRAAGAEVTTLQEHWQQGVDGMVAQIGSSLTKELQPMSAQLAESIVAERQQQAEQIQSVLSAAQEQQLQQLVTASEPMLAQMNTILQGQQQLMSQAETLRQLEDSVATTMAQLRQAGQFDQTLQQLSEQLQQLRPVVDKLRDPVPVQLSLVGVQAGTQAAPADLKPGQ